MSKYFSNNTDFSHYPINDDGNIPTSNIPEFTNENIISDEKKDILTNKQNNIELERIREQNIQLQKMLDNYTTETKSNIPNQFNNFAPAEIFEKLNQLIFVVSNLSNRITDMENTLKQQNRIITPTTTSRTISDPSQIVEFEKEFSKNKVQATLENIKKGKNIPMEDYIDNSVRLEEMFPELDDEAYQAGYNALSQIKSTNNKPTDVTVGNMRAGLNGF